MDGSKDIQIRIFKKIIQIPVVSNFHFLPLENVYFKPSLRHTQLA